MSNHPTGTDSLQKNILYGLDYLFAFLEFLTIFCLQIFLTKEAKILITSYKQNLKIAKKHAKDEKEKAQQETKQGVDDKKLIQDTIDLIYAEERKKDFRNRYGLTFEEILCYCFKINSLYIDHFPEVLFDNFFYIVIVLTAFIMANYPLVLLTTMFFIYALRMVLAWLYTDKLEAITSL